MKNPILSYVILLLMGSMVGCYHNGSTEKDDTIVVNSLADVEKPGAGVVTLRGDLILNKVSVTNGASVVVELHMDIRISRPSTRHRSKKERSIHGLCEHFEEADNAVIGC